MKRQYLLKGCLHGVLELCLFAQADKKLSHQSYHMGFTWEEEADYLTASQNRHTNELLFQVVISRSCAVQGPWLASNIFGMLSVEMPFEHTVHSFEPLQCGNISFLQGFDIWGQPEVFWMQVQRTRKTIVPRNCSCWNLKEGICYPKAGVHILEECGNLAALCTCLRNRVFHFI